MKPQPRHAIQAMRYPVSQEWRALSSAFSTPLVIFTYIVERHSSMLREFTLVVGNVLRDSAEDLASVNAYAERDVVRSAYSRWLQAKS
jgi:hypothetical protein